MRPLWFNYMYMLYWFKGQPFSRSLRYNQNINNLTISIFFQIHNLHNLLSINFTFWYTMNKCIYNFIIFFLIRLISKLNPFIVSFIFLTILNKTNTTILNVIWIYQLYLIICRLYFLLDQLELIWNNFIFIIEHIWFTSTVLSKIMNSFYFILNC